MKFAIRLLLLLGVGCVLTCNVWAQAAQVRGELRANDGQAVPGVRVNLDRQDQGLDNHYELETDSRGDFVHLSVAPGNYEITFEHDGSLYLALSRISAGEFEIQLDLDRLEYSAYEFNPQTGNAERVLRDIRKVNSTARIVRTPRNDEEAAAQKEKAASDAELAKAFEAGREALEAEDYEEAIAQFTLAGEYDSSQHVIFGNLGNALEREGRYEEAAASFQKAQDLLEFDSVPPEETNYFRNLTVNYAQAGDVDAALEYAERSAEVDPDGAARSFYTVGATLLNAGQTEGALVAFERAIELDENLPEPYFQAAIIHFNTDMSQAIPLLEKYLELAPDGPDAEGAAGLLEFARQNQ